MKLSGAKRARLQLYEVGLCLRRCSWIVSGGRSHLEWRSSCAGLSFSQGGRFATTIYAPIFEGFLPLCLGLARPEADKWVMPKLAGCVSCAAGLAIRSSGGRRQEVGSWERLRCEMGVGGGKDVKGWIEVRQDEDGWMCVGGCACECVWKSKSSQELLWPDLT